MWKYVGYYLKSRIVRTCTTTSSPIGWDGSVAVKTRSRRICPSVLVVVTFKAPHMFTYNTLSYIYHYYKKLI